MIPMLSIHPNKKAGEVVSFVRPGDSLSYSERIKHTQGFTPFQLPARSQTASPDASEAKTIGWPRNIARASLRVAHHRPRSSRMPGKVTTYSPATQPRRCDGCNRDQQRHQNHFPAIAMTNGILQSIGPFAGVGALRSSTPADISNRKDSQ
jgi:hypothetical protein